MSKPEDDRIADLPQSELTAEQLLTKLAKLIIDTADASQLTKDAVEETLCIQLEQNKEKVANYAARLTPAWNFTISLSTFETWGPSVWLRFVPTNHHPDLTMTDICTVDADAFGVELERAGFTRKPRNRIHGEHYGVEYRRGSLQVIAATVGEADEPNEQRSRACIESLRVRRRG